MAMAMAMAMANAAAAAELADVYTTGMWYIDDHGRTAAVPDSLSYIPTPRLFLDDPDISGAKPHLHQLVVFRKAVREWYPYYEGAPGEDLDFMLHQLALNRVRKIPIALYGHRRTLDGFSRRGSRARGVECDCPRSRRYSRGSCNALLRSARDVAAANFTEEFICEIEW